MFWKKKKSTGEEQAGAAKSVTRDALKDIKGKGHLVIVVNAGKEKRAQYFAAKKIREIWGTGDFSELMTKMKNGENVVLFRTDKRSEAKSLIDEFVEVGAKAWIVEQKQISGVDVF